MFLAYTPWLWDRDIWRPALLLLLGLTDHGQYTAASVQDILKIKCDKNMCFVVTTRQTPKYYGWKPNQWQGDFQNSNNKKILVKKLHMYLSVDPVDVAALGIYSV